MTCGCDSLTCALIVYGDDKGTATDPQKAAAKQAAAKQTLQALGIEV
jgi:dsRNA-specific ribonuclease